VETKRTRSESERARCAQRRRQRKRGRWVLSTEVRDLSPVYLDL
jgi:NMD protein affecting ribosome stability and mRNA decay